MEGRDRDTTTTLASPDKAIATLVAAGVTALLGMLTTGTADFAELSVVATSLVVAGAVYLQKYHARLPYKAAWALAIPLVIAVLRFVQTGEFDEAELQLAIQAVFGAIAAFVAQRRVLTTQTANR